MQAMLGFGPSQRIALLPKVPRICYQPAITAGILQLMIWKLFPVHLFSNETTFLFTCPGISPRILFGSCSSKDHRCLCLLPFGCCFAPTFPRGATQVQYLTYISLNYAHPLCPKPTFPSPTPSSRHQSIKFGTMLVISST